MFVELVYDKRNVEGLAGAREIILADWKKYRVLLMRVDTAKPVWPTPPGGQAS